jgi:hypothetical protein
MVMSLIALAALANAALTQTPDTQPSQTSAAMDAKPAAQIDRFAGRPNARIAFTRDVRNFEVKRENYDDILYLETSRNRWFRSEISCFGLADPLDAQALLPLDHGFGFDNFSKIGLVGFGHRINECRLDRLVELTPEEAVEFRLERPKALAGGKAVAPKAMPAS